MPRVFCLGSLNLDFVYNVDSIVTVGETISSSGVETHFGGKGANQSIALARAGATAFHIGLVGKDGSLLVENLRSNEVDITYVRTTNIRTGHAVIQVQQTGQNAIIVEAGANGAIQEELIKEALELAEPGDWFLTQNETNLVSWAVSYATQKGLKVAYNPSPFNPKIIREVLPCLSLLVLNETEANALTSCTSVSDTLERLKELSPTTDIVLTLGGDGAHFVSKTERHFQPAEKVVPVDSTAAGDTFLGYFIASLMLGNMPAGALKRASKAAALCVTRRGASASIPYASEIDG
jgi:ribokinase